MITSKLKIDFINYLEIEEDRANNYKKPYVKNQNYLSINFFQYQDSNTQIFKRLSIKDILSFEQVAKDHQSLTQHYWKSLAKQHFCDFNWQACESQEIRKSKEKWNYILSLSIFRYLNSYTQNPLHFHETEKISPTQQKFNELSKKFPVLASFIKNITAVPAFHQEISLGFSLGGENLLRAIQESRYIVKGQISNEKKKKIEWAFEIAIKNHHVKFASLFAYRLLKDIPIFHDKIEEWVVLSAKNKYFPAISKYITNKSVQELENFIQKGYPLGPILEALAYREHDLAKKSQLFNKSIIDYGPFASVSLLIDAALVDVALNNQKQATLWIEQVFLNHQEDALKELKAITYEAYEVNDSFCIQQIAFVYCIIIEKYNEHLPVSVITDAACLYYALGNCQKAIDLYEKAMTRYGDKVPLNLLLEATLIEIEQKNRQKAIKLLKQAQKAETDDNNILAWLSKQNLIEAYLFEFQDLLACINL